MDMLPRSIIAKYIHKTYRDGKLFPILSNQKTNTYLKEIADLCGIKKNLTFHLARHTFAAMSLSKGMPMESVSKMLGHTNIKADASNKADKNKQQPTSSKQVRGGHALSDSPFCFLSLSVQFTSSRR